MGILSRLKPKEEKLYVDPETKETVWIPIKKEKEQPHELTREEQMEPKRLHPWQTPHGRRVVKSIGGGLQRLDKAVVKYNRRRPISKPMSSYSTHNNYNPFGYAFDTGMQPMSHPRKKKTSKAKYAVVGGKAYPIASSDKKKTKKKTKRKRSDPFGFDNDPFKKWRL